jgi:transcriptional regulator with XRE-family HTH domain
MSDVERGRQLAEMRTAAGMTQPQVALVFEISKQAVREWEAGKSAPDRRKLLRLDALYSANGKVLALYDVANDDIMELRETLADLRKRLADLEALSDEALPALEDLTRRVVRLEGDAGQSAAQ